MPHGSASRRPFRARFSFLLLGVLLPAASSAFPSPSCAQQAPAGRTPDASVSVYETEPLPSAPTRAQWEARAAWAQPAAPAGSKGGWVIANARLLASIQPGAEAIEAIAFDGDTLWEPVFRLSPNNGNFRGRISRARLLAADAETEARLSVTWADGAGERTLHIAMGFRHPSVEILAPGKDLPLSVESISDYIIAGDPRGYDALVSADSDTNAVLNIPLGNRAFPYAVQPLQGGNALLVVTAPEPADLRIRRDAGPDGNPVFAEMRTRLRAGTSLWFSVPAAPDIWSAGDASLLSRTRDLEWEWTPPFPAQWRLNLTYASGLYEGNSIHFDAGYPLPDGRMFCTGSGWPRENPRLWSSTRRYYFIPLQFTNSSVLLRTPRFARGQANGAVQGFFVLYPHDRNRSHPAAEHLATPEGAITIMDVVQAALGKERMAEYKQGPRMNPYPSTCDTTALIEKYVTQEEALENEEEIRRRGATLGSFVALHRQRIDEYRDWHKAYEAFCRDRLDRAPENEALRKAAEELQAITDTIPGVFLGQEETMGDAHLTREQAEIMVNAALSRDANKKEIVDAAGRQIRVYGGQHDHAVSEYRAALQLFRQQAFRLHLTEPDPETRRFLRESLEFSEDLLKPNWRYENRA